MIKKDSQRIVEGFDLALSACEIVQDCDMCGDCPIHNHCLQETTVADAGYDVCNSGWNDLLNFADSLLDYIEQKN